MLGGNVKPYLLSDSIATQNINLYKYTRLAGLAQMWVIAPLLAYKHYTYDPGKKIAAQAFQPSMKVSTPKKKAVI